MDIQVFNRSDKGNYFNKSFFNYKMDLEKGVEPLFAARYDVDPYPALLFLTPDETLIYKTDYTSAWWTTGKSIRVVILKYCLRKLCNYIVI